MHHALLDGEALIAREPGPRGLALDVRHDVVRKPTGEEGPWRPGAGLPPAAVDRQEIGEMMRARCADCKPSIGL
jgi:hypothetical protein